MAHILLFSEGKYHWADCPRQTPACPLWARPHSAASGAEGRRARGHSLEGEAEICMTLRYTAWQDNTQRNEPIRPRRGPRACYPCS